MSAQCHIVTVASFSDGVEDGVVGYWFNLVLSESNAKVLGPMPNGR